MEDLIPILVFIFFLLAPLIERILKGGKQAPPTPPPQRPVPRPREELPEPKSYQRRSETAAEPESETAGTAGSAAEMLPEDLWAILTGEAPPTRTPGPVQQREPLDLPAPAPAPRAPAPRPPAPRPERPRREPLPSQQRAAKYEEAALDEESIAPREPTGDRPARFEYVPQDYRRPKPVEAEPVIVSMETLPESDETRHSSFHRRLAALAAPSEVQRGKARVDSGLHDPVQLRRAIIVSEILGKPKGLE